MRQAARQQCNVIQAAPNAHKRGAEQVHVARVAEAHGNHAPGREGTGKIAGADEEARRNQAAVARTQNEEVERRQARCRRYC